MRVLKLTKDSVQPATAAVIENTRNRTLYFNIWHGTRGYNFWSYICTLNHKFFSPRTCNDLLALSNDNYVLKPVIKQSAIVKDKKGNDLYCISVDNDPRHIKDILLFWEIPNTNYKNVTYTMCGDVILLGEGSTGKARGDTIYISPAPVLEIIGDCDLFWSAEDSHGNTISQHITVRPQLLEPITIGELTLGVNNGTKL